MKELKLHQKLSAAAIVVMVAILLFFMVRDEASVAEHAQTAELPADYEKFRAEEISLSKYDGNNMSFSLTVHEIYQRKRLSKVFVYENVKELFFRGVRLEINSSGSGKSGIPLEDLGGSLAAFESSIQPVNSAMNRAVPDSEMSLVSRVVMDSVEVNLHLGNGAKVGLSSDTAFINSLFDMLIMQGNVTVSSGGRVLTAEKAVWTSRHNGLFFPDGYRDGGKVRRGKGFFRIDGNALTEVKKAPEIDCTDELEERERMFYDGFAGNLSVMEKLALGLPLASGQDGAASSAPAHGKRGPERGTSRAAAGPR